mmetsp:Transcript_111238/g.325373  ORF Transcript_111238/g.325373 Transcript_111238/m.325373 type:complete len:218 (-) Transcript_111238:470-1123(-)
MAARGSAEDRRGRPRVHAAGKVPAWQLEALAGLPERPGAGVREAQELRGEEARRHRRQVREGHLRRAQDRRQARQRRQGRAPGQAQAGRVAAPAQEFQGRCGRGGGLGPLLHGPALDGRARHRPSVPGGGSAHLRGRWRGVERSRAQGLHAHVRQARDGPQRGKGAARGREHRHEPGGLDLRAARGPAEGLRGRGRGLGPAAARQERLQSRLQGPGD